MGEGTGGGLELTLELTFADPGLAEQSTHKFALNIPLLDTDLPLKGRVAGLFLGLHSWVTFSSFAGSFWGLVCTFWSVMLGKHHETLQGPEPK